MAIFDDLHTLVLMIPLKMVKQGWRWQFSLEIAVILIALIAAFRWLHTLRLGCGWKWPEGGCLAKGRPRGLQGSIY